MADEVFRFYSPSDATKESNMEIKERLAKLEKHIGEHPADYQAVIACVKLHSDMIDHERRQREILELRHIAEIRKRRKNEEQG